MAEIPIPTQEAGRRGVEQSTANPLDLALTDPVTSHFLKNAFFIELEGFLDFFRLRDDIKPQDVLLVVHNRRSVRRWNGGCRVSEIFDDLVFGRFADLKLRHGVRIGQSCWTSDGRASGKSQKNEKTKRKKPTKKAWRHEGLLLVKKMPDWNPVPDK